MPAHSPFSPPPPATPEPADSLDATLACLLTQAHAELPPAVWVDREVERREAALTAWFAMRLAQARACGQVLLVTDPNDEQVLGVAVLLHRQDTEFPPPPEMDTSRLPSATAIRLAALDERIKRTLPCEPHLHLLAVAVRQNHDDVELELLDQVHRYADEAHLPLYTVAWDARAVATYTRRGWCSQDDMTRVVPGRPQMFPMLRRLASTSLPSGDVEARAATTEAGPLVKVRWKRAWAVGIAAGLVVSVANHVVDIAKQAPDVVAGGQENATGAAPVSWAPRGALNSSTALIERAVTAWRQAPDPGARPAGAPKVLYADRSTPGLVNVVSVVLAAGQQVAWVSTPTTTGTPAVDDQLVVRAVTTVATDAWGIGFVAIAPFPQDAEIRGGGAVSFVLAAPGARSRLVSSALDMGLVDDGGEEVSTRVVPAEVAAWNSTVHSRRTDSATRVDPVAAGSLDPVTPAVSVIATGMGPRVSEGAPGDWVITRTGWLGVVGADHRVDTTLAALPAALRGQMAITGETVTVDGTDRLGGVPPAANRGNRVVLADSGGVRINLGHLTGGPATGWRLARAVPADTTGPALLWPGHR